MTSVNLALSANVGEAAPPCSNENDISSTTSLKSPSPQTSCSPSHSQRNKILSEQQQATSLIKEAIPWTPKDTSPNKREEQISQTKDTIELEVEQPLSLSVNEHSEASVHKTRLRSKAEKNDEINHLSDTENEFQNTLPKRLDIQHQTTTDCVQAAGNDEVVNQTPKRPPKRKAAEKAEAKTRFELPHDLAAAAMTPIAPEERNQWKRWVEVESDPAFFSHFLNELGAKDVQVYDIMSLDDDMGLGLLPNSIYGLVFLYQYFDEENGEVKDNCSPEVWFANQTTDNACATVALFNIIMNSNISLGPKLDIFRAETKNICAPLRGFMLANNSFIRNIHNSFTRRLDFLNAELLVDNKVESYSKESKRRKVVKTLVRKGRSLTKRSRPAPDNGFHFIAYVPANGKVWELDGLQRSPTCLGSYDDSSTKDWVSVARPTIEVRMCSADGQAFNLLAVCQRPETAIRQQLASNTHALELLTSLSPDQPIIADYVKQANMEIDMLRDTKAPDWMQMSNVLALGEFGLQPLDVATATLPYNLIQQLEILNSKLVRLCENARSNTDSSLMHQILNVIELRSELRHQWTTEHRRLRMEYTNLLSMRAQDEEKVVNRQKDYGAFILMTLRKLANAGHLKAVFQDTFQKSGDDTCRAKRSAAVSVPNALSTDVPATTRNLEIPIEYEKDHTVQLSDTFIISSDGGAERSL